METLAHNIIFMLMSACQSCINNEMTLQELVDYIQVCLAALQQHV